MATTNGFGRLDWQEGRVLLDDLVFRLDNHSREPSDDSFDLYKGKPMISRYATLLDAFDATNIVELGMWDGGSTALWAEVLNPAKLIGIDLDPRGDSPYYKAWLANRQLEERVHTHWGVDQADHEGLRALVNKEFTDPLDLVIDDCSHLYEPTKTSFETLFPLLRPGGLYVIEDWAWGHAIGFDGEHHPWANEEPLTTLVVELVEMLGTYDRCTASSLLLYPGMLVVERGLASLDSGSFKLEDHIRRRSSTPPL